MEKNKVIIIALVVLIVFGLIGVMVILFNKNDQPTPQTDSYVVSVDANNKNIGGNLKKDGKTTQLTQEDINKYALVSFNSTYDILWFECPAGFLLTNPTSSTGNKITQIPDSGQINIEIAPDKSNNITATCSKK